MNQAAIPANSPEAMPKAPSDLLSVVRFFRRYRLGILLVTIAAALVGALIALSLPAVYRSTVTLLIEPRTPHLVQVQEVYDPTQGLSSEYFATQFELLRSRGLATRVVDKLKLADDDDFLRDTSSESMLASIRRRTDWKQFLPGLPEEAPAVAPT